RPGRPLLQVDDRYIMAPGDIEPSCSGARCSHGARRKRPTGSRSAFEGAAGPAGGVETMRPLSRIAESPSGCEGIRGSPTTPVETERPSPSPSARAALYPKRVNGVRPRTPSG